MREPMSVSEALPREFEFYGWGRVERASDDGAAAPTDVMYPADALVRPACVSFVIQGIDASARLHLFFEDSADPSPWCEVGNVLASRLADRWEGLPSPPVLRRGDDAHAIARRLAGAEGCEIVRFVHVDAAGNGSEIVAVAEPGTGTPEGAHA